VKLIYTHPNSNLFSQADRNVAANLGINAYVVGPNLILQRYNISDNSTVEFGRITPRVLTAEERKALELEFRASWENHIAGECPFNCHNMTWPTPVSP